MTIRLDGKLVSQCCRNCKFSSGEYGMSKVKCEKSEGLVSNHSKCNEYNFSKERFEDVI